VYYSQYSIRPTLNTVQAYKRAFADQTRANYTT
jgi:hypothetical protein